MTKPIAASHTPDKPQPKLRPNQRAPGTNQRIPTTVTPATKRGIPAL